jgi:murein DD-endopeptidase MepM/ murein hydrolase activator NlpD
VVVEVTTPPASTVSAAGEALTVPTETPTAAGPPTVTLTPTPTPTPVPRTVRADSLPDYSQTEDHFWFTRPFTAAHLTWGSAYYPFGTNAQGQYLWHHGIDIQNPLQTPIQAVADGLVVHAGPDLDRVLGPYPDFFGQAVLIRHDRRLNDEPVYTLYGHVSQVLVTEGEHVSAGQIIARVGQEGIALGPHLHLEVRLGQATYWDTRNPDLWIRPDPAFGVIAGRVIDADGYFVPQQLVTLHRAEEPDRFWRQSWTYPDNEFKFDPVWGETYTFSDVPVGPYVVKTHFDGRLYSQPITVTNQSTTFVHIEGLAPPPSLSPEATVEVPGSATPEASPTASE